MGSHGIFGVEPLAWLVAARREAAWTHFLPSSCFPRVTGEFGVPGFALKCREISLGRTRGCFKGDAERWRRVCLSRLCHGGCRPCVTDSCPACVRGAEKIRHYRSEAGKEMRRQPHAERTRNIGVFAHIDAGKTSCTEAMLFNARETAILGNVDDGTTVMDFLEQERQRGITVRSAATVLGWRDHQLNIIDTPGHIDFTAEVARAVTALDGAVVIIDGLNGVQAQTRTVWRQIVGEGKEGRRNLATIIFVNKLDREAASMEYCVESCKQTLGCWPLQLVVPAHLKTEHDKIGLINLVDLTLHWYPMKTVSGEEKYFVEKGVIQPQCVSLDRYLTPARELPVDTLLDENILEIVKQKRQTLLEDVSILLDDIEGEEKLLQEGSVQPFELWRALRRITLASSQAAVCVLGGSAQKNAGIDILLDGICNVLPNPLESLSPTRRICGADIQVTFSRNCMKFSGLQDTTRAPAPAVKDVDSNTAIAALVFKVLSDGRGGRLAFIRLYSGTLKGTASLFNPNRKRVEQLKGIYKIHADRYTKVNQLEEGDIGMVRGLSATRTGDTLISFPLPRDGHPQAFVYDNGSVGTPPLFFSSIKAVSDDDTNLITALEEQCLEDPSLQFKVEEDTGQIVVGGVGELHLQILQSRLVSEYGISTEMGNPQIAYREFLEKQTSGSLDISKPQGMNSLTVGVTLEIAPLKHNNDDSPSPDATKSGSALQNVERSWSLNFAELCEVTIADSVKVAIAKFEGETQASMAVEELKQTLEAESLTGPLLGMPLLSLRITLRDIKWTRHTPLALAKSCASKLFRKLKTESSARLLEPVCRLHVSAPKDDIGGVLSDLTHRRRARILHVTAGDEQGGAKQGSLAPDTRMHISAIIPLETSCGYASILRSQTRGAASFQLHPFGYEPVSNESQESILLGTTGRFEATRQAEEGTTLSDDT